MIRARVAGASPRRLRWLTAAALAVTAAVRMRAGLGSGGGIGGLVDSTPDAPNGPGGAPGILGTFGSFFTGGGGSGPGGDDDGSDDYDDEERDDDYDDGEGDDPWFDEEALRKVTEDLAWHAMKSRLPPGIDVPVDLMLMAPEVADTLHQVGKHNKRNREAEDLVRREREGGRARKDGGD